MKKDIKTKLTLDKERRLREVPEFVFDFIKFYPKKSLTTQIEYIKDIKKFLDFLMSYDEFTDKKDVLELTLDDIKKAERKHIDDFLSYLVEYKKTFKKRNGEEVTQTFSNTEVGISRKLATLHTFFKYLVKEEIIGVDPSVNVGVSITKNINTSNRLNDDELSKYLASILDDVNVESKKALEFHQKLKYRDFIIALILSYTGIRVSELVQLDILDVNLDKGKITVFRKRNKRQTLDLPDKIIEPIKDYIEERKKVENVDSKYKDALFLSLQKKRINTRTVRHLINKYALRSEIEMKVTPHAFRKTFGTKFYNTHGDIEMTRDVLGHETSDTTRHYVHIDEERERQAMKEFDYSYGDASASSEIKLNNDKLKKLADKTGMSLEELIKTLTESE